jgi:hypothetical protein
MSKLAAASLLAVAIMVPGVAGAAGMTMKADNGNVTVVEKDGQSLVPLRQIAESLGYSVMWTKKSIVLTKSIMMETKEPVMEDKATAGSMDMKEMNESKAMNKEMSGTPYTVTVMPGSKNAMVGMDKKMLTYAPTYIQDKAYVTKAFVDMYLASPMRMTEPMK